MSNPTYPTYDEQVEAWVLWFLRQEAPDAALTREWFTPQARALATAQIPVPTPIPCRTCGGTGQVTYPDPADSAWFPKPARIYRCPDCTNKKETS